MPAHDHCGYEIAIDMVLMSKSPGRHSKDYLQFETIRNLRTTYGHFERISSVKAHQGLHLEGGDGESKDISDLVTSSLWFRRFTKGCKARIGQTCKPNLGLNADLFVKLLGLLAKNIQSAEDIKTQFGLVAFGSFVACS